MAYEATAELYKRQYDLAKKRAQSEYESRIGDLATQYRQANRDLEGNLESRGILRSGEGMRGRVRLGSAEKAAQLSAEAARQSALDTAGLSYMQQLAELQAKGYKGGTAPDTGGGTPGTPAPTTPGSPGTPQAPATPTPPAQQTPVGEQPASCPVGSVWDPIKKTCVPISGLPTVGGTPVPPGQTPSETRPPAPNTVGGGASGKPPKYDFSDVDWEGLGKIIGYKPPKGGGVSGAKVR